jgi:hypothetical protein
MKLVNSIVTEHLHDKDRWKNCARLFCHDHKNINFKSRIRIKDCFVDFYLYQVFEIFVMFEMKMFQHEDYNANDMSLKKIRKLQYLLSIENFDSFRNTNDKNIETHRIESRVIKVSWDDSWCTSTSSMKRTSKVRNNCKISRKERSLFFVQFLWNRVLMCE